MKRLLILLSVLFLLTGCQTKPPIATTPTTPPTTAPTTTPTEVPQEAQPTEPLNLSLLEHAEPAGTSGNLVYIPNSHVESMLFPEILRCGNDLLLYEVMPTGLLQLKLISLIDGSLLAEASYPLSPAALVQAEKGIVSICDYGSGQVLILDESLQPEKSYTVPMEGENWYLNPEMETLYVFFHDTGLMSRNLTTGETQWLLENVTFLNPYGAENGYVLFSYTDRADQMTYNSCLNFSTGKLENAPVGAYSSGVRCGEQWFMRQNDTFGKYILLQQDTSNAFSWPEGFCTLLTDKSHLFMTDGNYRELYLYDLEGRFLSHCVLPEMEYASVGTDLVWSDYYQGYFFHDNYDGMPHLMFWDPSVPQDGENIVWESSQSTVHVMEQAFYDRAAAISQRFDVEIRIAEQCGLDYFEYESTMLTNPEIVTEALGTIEQALSLYPEGYFSQLLYENVRTIRIEVVDGLSAKEGIISHPTFAAGVAEKASDHYKIILDGVGLDAHTVYHEFTHLTDSRLEWDALLRADALFNEETWLTLQPDGFYFPYSYVDKPEELEKFVISGYFARQYSMTFPTEDRATMMDFTMVFKAALKDNPGLEKKMQYYAACIRDCFDTTGWPEKTVWE